MVHIFQGRLDSFCQNEYPHLNGTHDDAEEGRTHVLLAIVVRRVTTHPFRDKVVPGGGVLMLLHAVVV